LTDGLLSLALNQYFISRGRLPMDMDYGYHWWVGVIVWLLLCWRWRS